MTSVPLTGAARFPKRFLCLGIVLLMASLGCDPLFIDFVPPSGGPDHTSDPAELVVVTIDTVGQGRVLVDPNRTSFRHDTKIRLSAVADHGWWFSHWEGDAAGDNSVVSVTMNRDKHVTAVFMRIAPDMVELTVLPVGHGSVILDPAGMGREEGELYPRGTTVALTAVPDAGWAFVGYYDTDGELLADTDVMDLVLGDSIAVVAEFGEIVPLPPPVYLDWTVMGADLQFLGVISDDPFDPESLANPYGIYGDEFSLLSIWNSFSVYGSAFSDLSAYDPFASDPPSVYLNGVFQGYLTTNPDFAPRFDPDDVAADIGRYDVIRY